MLLPLQGAGCASHLPRALPWADSFLAFQAVFAELAKVESDKFEGIVAASPSVWYPKWLEYATNNTPGAKSVYLTLWIQKR